jgi:tetratricopeptide (TPR) repeat protein
VRRAACAVRAKRALTAAGRLALLGDAAHVDALVNSRPPGRKPPSIRAPIMLRELSFVQRRGPQRRRSNLVTLAVLLVLALGVGRAGAESETDRPAPFGETEGVPDAWIVALNDYVSDPQAAAPRLIAIEREAGGELPPMVQVVVADAYLRTGNRRAAQRLFEDVLASDPGYPWNDFGNVGMGTVRMMAGDTEGAELYFGRLTEAVEGSSQAMGNLGMGSALAADGDFADAKQYFDKVGTSQSVDEEVRLAGRFGSATAQYGAGDYEGALQAFEAIAASDPDGPTGRDARFAAARARLALGQVDEATASLRAMTSECDDEPGARRTSRALRNLDARAIGRTWVRNYRTRSWVKLNSDGNSMYSIGGCGLARTTLRAVERGDASLTGVQRVATGAANETTTAPAPPAQPRRDAQPVAAPSSSGSGWLPVLIGVLAALGLGVYLLRRARAS